MRIEPSILYEILRKVFLYRSGSTEIDVATLRFREDGLRVSEISTDRTIAISAVFKPSLFMDYEPIGDIPVDGGLVKVVLDYFKTDESVEFKVSTNEKGERKLELIGTNEEYIRKLPSQPTTPFETKVTEFGYVPSKLDVECAYLTQAGYLRGLSGDYVKFKYGADGLTVSVSDNLSEYIRRIDYTKHVGEGSGEVSYHVLKLSKVLAVFSGQVWVCFTGIGLPVIISQVTEVYTVSYVIAPMVVT